MIDRSTLLADLQALLKRIEQDLRERCDTDQLPEVRQWLDQQYAQARQAERTALTQPQWTEDMLTQVAVAWVLSCVFVRFLEDNRLVDPPRLSGSAEDGRLQRARDEHELFFREHPTLTDREYLLNVFNTLAELSVTRQVFGPDNPLRLQTNWLSGDAAGELLRFFQRIDPDSGRLLHDFSDPDWDTRFLGDLYQDLSEAARKKYALLQTPEFVEEFILDRTLEPALDEFGLRPPGQATAGSTVGSAVGPAADQATADGFFKLLDPACGSGHFLLGAFPRLLDRWQRAEPAIPVRELVQRALHSIHGVDVNPYAIAIARFRLLLAAMRACDITRLRDAPQFRLHLACGDSLYHGRLRQATLGDWSDDAIDQAHYFAAEDQRELERILREGTCHCVVANPPYITPKDRAANQAYRQLYPETCHMKYSLAVPFLERIVRLGVSAAYTGQITANSFMKREFGKKLIEKFFPQVDLTHVIDTSGAYIPGHGTPTVILLARSRRPVADTIRTVMGIRGEPSTPADPARGQVWSAIVNQVDQPGSESDFVSVADSPRGLFHQHPWSIGGGGAAELKEKLDGTVDIILKNITDSIGITSFTLEDDIYILPRAAARRSSLKKCHTRQMVVGDAIRDWSQADCDETVFPYESSFQPIAPDNLSPIQRYLWRARTGLSNCKMFGGKTKVDAGLQWYEFGRLTADKLRTPLSIVFAEVATHNHFVLDRGGKVFNRTAPVIKLPPEVSTPDGGTRPVTEDDHLALLGLLNSSTACFWMKQVCFPKGGDHVGQEGARVRRSLWDERYALNATNIEKLPLPAGRPLKLTRVLDDLAQQLQSFSPGPVLSNWLPACEPEPAADNTSRPPLADVLATAELQYTATRERMIQRQEDLDWHCYQLYGLLEEDLVLPADAAEADCGLKLGQRAFEIVLARRLAAGETQTTWFERHGSTPRTELPADWPPSVRELVERRVAAIAAHPEIALIEQPEYKRRWNTEPWSSQVDRALRQWLLDRLESYFDFDGRMNEAGLPTARVDSELISVARLADLAGRDPQFLEVGSVYRDDPAFDVAKLVTELVQSESVPMLPVLRYKPSGLRKRQQWEQTWELQRREDAGEEVGDIPVPPKYTSADFISSGGARYWALRGKLDVPKERWISFPHCHGADDTLTVCWAGYDHLQQATAIAAHYVHVKEDLGGADDPRLLPLLGCLQQLLPWLTQWHNEPSAEYDGLRMGDYYAGFVAEEARHLNLTLDEIAAWQPPKAKARRRARKT